MREIVELVKEVPIRTWIRCIALTALITAEAIFVLLLFGS
jgi:hypothetical protein